MQASPETFENASGFAALAASPDDDLPLTVRGVALAEGVTTKGASKKPTYWPRETLEAATEALEGRKIVDDSAHDIPDGASPEDIPFQPPAKTVIGEITEARYKPGVGIVYEGEIDDADYAALVENGRVDVSPFLFPKRGEFDESRNAYPAQQIVHWRDLAVVSEGNEGASIEAASAAEALTAEALKATFESDGDEAAESATDGADGTSDDPEGASTADPDSDAETNPGTDPEEDLMDLTDNEKQLIQRARTMDSPAVVEEDAEALAQTAAQFEDPTVVETADYEALGDQVEDMKGVLAEALAERTDMKVETAEALTLEALIGEFSDEDGEFDIEALVQNPEAGGSGDGDGGDGGDTGVDALSEDARADVRSKLARADTMQSAAPEHAEALRSEAAETVGVDSHEDIDMEAL
ncbi:hypothetical protein [Halomarina oriensis]|uniref:Uncharacterized protein n=1 Tax=Halomarina oriensis TaxID=671145 RepID=A0A6B0GMX6_9EURY|nr:hypothetical protein [Halomarina oriensis]MWG34829.1 hypothetical protein [Halomarina oriensis]